MTNQRGGENAHIALNCEKPSEIRMPLCAALKRFNTVLLDYFDQY